MSATAFVRPKWRKRAPLGYGNAIDSVGTVASPLLAGFSLASVIVVSDDAANFRWPGGAIFALTIAAVALIGAVQCAFNARQYLWSGADVLAWWPDMKEGSEREKLLRDEQAVAFHRWAAWSKWTRRAYNCGILALLAGLALASPPAHGASVQADLRWAAAGVAIVACAGEAFWIITASWQRALDTRRGGGPS